MAFWWVDRLLVFFLILSYQKLYAICVDDKAIVFKLKVFSNSTNFPRHYIENGDLEPPEVRVHWRPEQKIKYYLDDGDENNEEPILEASILEMCK